MKLVDAGLFNPVWAGTRVEALTDDTAFLQAILAAEVALVRAQAHLGTIPYAAAELINSCAAENQIDVREISLIARETANPVVGVVAALRHLVAESDAAAAEFVHRGSTSQDVLDTGLMLMASQVRDVLVADLRKVRERATELAAEHRSTPQIGRTLGLHAVPTTFGLKVSGWRRLVDDAIVRLESLRLPVSMGGAAGTMSGYLDYAAPSGGKRDRGVYAQQLVTAFALEIGLEPELLPWHALRTPMADLAHATAFVTTALGKIAADVLVMTRTEIAELAEPTQDGRGASSAMPHKRNPVLATMIRSAALQAPSFASIVLSCVATEDERSAGMWHAEWAALRGLFRLAGGSSATAVELLDGLTVFPARMGENLGMSAAASSTERVAARLASFVGRERAHTLVSDAVTRALTSGRPLRDLLAEELSAVSPALAKSLDDMLNPLTYVGAAEDLTLVDVESV